MKTVGIFWSGGLDSTFLIYQNLKEGNKVYAFYVELKNNKIKTEMELETITKLAKIFDNEFNIREKRFVVKRLGSIEIGFWKELYSGTIPQQLTWLLFAGFNTKGIDEVQMGYVMGDDAISYLEEFKQIFDLYNVVKKENTKITFPLYQEHKLSIANSLPDDYKKYIVFCEKPKIIKNKKEVIYKPCGKCHSCLIAKTNGVFKINKKKS